MVTKYSAICSTTCSIIKAVKVDNKRKKTANIYSKIQRCETLEQQFEVEQHM